MLFYLRILVVILFVGFSTDSIYAQTEYEPFRADTTSQLTRPANVAAIGFDKNLATYQWNGVVKFDKSIGLFSLRLNEQFRSTIIQTPRKLIRDEQSLEFKVKHQWVDQPTSIVSGLAGMVQVNNFVLSDDQRFSDGQRPSLTSASSNAMYGGIEAGLFKTFFIEPLIGVRYDNQVSIRDNGISFVVSVWSPKFDLESYQTTFAGKFQRDLLLPRTLEKRSVTIGIERTFFERTRNALQANYSLNQRDFYFAADSNVGQEFNTTNNIERRIESSVAISDLLDYNIGERFLLSFQGNLSSRLIDRTFRYRPIAGQSVNTLFNTGVEEFKIGGAAQLAYTSGDDVAATVQFLINERDERHSVETDERISPIEIDKRAREEAKKDNLSRRTTLSSTLNVALSRWDRILFSGSTNLLRYDTPSKENVEDRDELWYSFNLTTLHQVNSHLHLSIAADMNLIHLVYILKERSANNTWNRVFRLAPRLQYIPSNDFSSTNTFEVLANYTVYDFENRPSVQMKSFSFRQFGLVDSTRLALTSRFALGGYTHIRLYQRGELRWDAFKERPVNYFEDKTFIGRVEYMLEQRLLLSVGIRYFSQIRFGYAAGTRVFESLLKSIGPLGALRWQVGDRSQLVIDGWYERQTQTNALPRGFANMTMSLTVHL